MAIRLLCTPRRLSADRRTTAASFAANLGLGNSGGDSTLSPAERLLADARERGSGVSPAVIALVKANYWGKHGKRLTTSFMDNPPKALRKKILQHLNLWSTRANVQFVESNLDPMVRIDRRTGKDWGGYWSYVGTEILGVPKDEPTMNFEGFTTNTSLSEFRRVVCHEAGHTLGFPHEHMRKELVQRIDPAKAYPYFLRTEGWSKQDVDDQVLTPLGQRTIIGTPPDQTSIMCYQLPGSIMRDSKPILGGVRINETDYVFSATMYPLPANASAGAAKKAAKPRKKTSKRKSAKPRKKTSKRKSAKRAPKRRSAAKRR